MSAGRSPPPWWYDPAHAPPWAARLLSVLYGWVIRLRMALFARGWLRAHRVGAPVIVVGNIVAGGSGKTPLAIALVERLRAAGRNPGVATRGYGRDDSATPRWVDASSDPLLAGDEPLLIARRTGVKVRADRDRVAAAQALVEAGCDVIVSDDGLQHYRLARDIEIEVLDARRRHGNALLLPAGPLREPVARAERCDFHVVNLPDASPSTAGAADAATGFGEWPMHLVADRALPLRGGRAVMLDSLAGQRVHAVAGIGDPERFFAMLRARGIAIVPHAFPDHHRYAEGDFAFGSDLPVLMTEKDAVKAAPFATPRFHSVPIRAELPEAFWLALLDRI